MCVEKHPETELCAFMRVLCARIRTWNRWCTRAWHVNVLTWRNAAHGRRHTTLNTPQTLNKKLQIQGSRNNLPTPSLQSEEKLINCCSFHNKEYFWSNLTFGSGAIWHKIPFFALQSGVCVCVLGGGCTAVQTAEIVSSNSSSSGCRIISVLMVSSNG